MYLTKKITCGERTTNILICPNCSGEITASSTNWNKPFCCSCLSEWSSWQAYEEDCEKENKEAQIKYRTLEREKKNLDNKSKNQKETKYKKTEKKPTKNKE